MNTKHVRGHCFKKHTWFEQSYNTYTLAYNATLKFSISTDLSPIFLARSNIALSRTETLWIHVCGIFCHKGKLLPKLKIHDCIGPSMEKYNRCHFLQQHLIISEGKNDGYLLTICSLLKKLQYERNFLKTLSSWETCKIFNNNRCETKAPYIWASAQEPTWNKWGVVRPIRSPR